MSRAASMAWLASLGFGLAAAAMPVVRAQDAPAAAEAPASATAPAGERPAANAPADSAAADSAGADANGSDAAPLGAAEARAAGDELNEFIPSEEIPPDEQVTFPADI